MRKKTLAGLCFLICFVMAFSFKFVARSQGLRFNWLTSHAYYYFIPLALAPVLMIPLSKLNQRLLDWRKARGRDIEEEEKYETDSGMISLRPVRSDEPPARDR
jgi:hypothetical protein